jgi:hypothetical protein
LCMAVGLGVLQPQDPSHNPSATTIAVSGGIAWVVSAIIATFLGGWAAGHLARQRSDADSVLHGLVVWGMGIVLMAILGATAVGMVVGGAFSLMGAGLHGAGAAVGGMAHGAGAATGGLASAAGSALSSGLPTSSAAPSFNWGSIKNKAERLLHTAPAAAPRDAESAAGRATTPGPDASSAQAPRPEQTQPAGSTSTSGVQAAKDAEPDETMDLITRIFSSPTGTMSDADRSALITQLAAGAGLSRADAEHQVQHWEQVASKAKADFATLKADAERQARDAAASAAKALSAAAWLAFVATAFAASAAMLGAHLGGLCALSMRTHIAAGASIPADAVKA